MKRLVLLTGCFCALCPSLYSQDNHYESLQLGSKNALLSGAALSHWVDPTAVVHNAATMMDAKEAGIAFNSTTGGFDKIRFDNGLGEGVDIKTSDFQLYPGLIAADLPLFKQADKYRLGIAIFARVSDRTRFTNRGTRTDNIINDVEMPGSETYIGQYTLDIDVRETTAAMGWATRLSEHWSAGVTAMALIRNQRYRENFNANAIADPALSPTVDVVSSESDISMKLNYILLQMKGSLAWKNGPWNLGFVLTAPSMKLYSGGDMLAQIELTNIRPIDSLNRRSYFASTYLEKLKPKFKYPISLSVGVSRSFENVVLSAAGTFYGNIDRYLVVDPGDASFLQPPTENNIIYTQRFLEVWASNRPLVNSSISAEWMLNPRTSLMGGLRTDLHYAEFIEPIPLGFQLPKKIWNRYHFNVGASLNGKRSRWIFGVQYSHGQADDYLQPYSFDGAAENNLLQGVRSKGNIRANGLTGIVSFLFYVNRPTEEN